MTFKDIALCRKGLPAGLGFLNGLTFRDEVRHEAQGRRKHEGVFMVIFNLLDQGRCQILEACVVVSKMMKTMVMASMRRPVT